MPFSAPLPVPTMIAVGVARPIAQGQAMMRTAIAVDRAKGRRGSGPSSIQAANVRSATTMTAGTNQPVTRSATRWIGAFEPWARSTSATICESAVSRPTRSARMTKDPDAFIVAPMTRSPGPFSTGIDSPVSIDSSTVEAPSIDRPVHGDAIAGTHAHEVAGDDLVERNLPLATGSQDPGRRRAEAEERLDRSGGAALGARLQPSAEQDEADDDRRRVEVVLVAEAGRHDRLRQERDEHRVRVGGHRAEGDERVHRRVAVPRGLQRRDQEAPSEDELDDRGRHEEPAVDLDHRPGRAARPEHDRHHHQADAERGQRLDEQLAPLAGMRIGVDVVRLDGRRVARDVVAGCLDRGHDAGAVDDGRVVLAPSPARWRG